MASRKCPMCSASVKLENLGRHAAKVHPGRTIALSDEERETVRRSPKRKPRMTAAKRPIVAVGLFVSIVAGIALGVPYLTGPNANDHGGPIHYHPQLSIRIDGQSVTVPVNIGIDPALWRDHSLDEYGMSGSMAPLHTHDANGQIHVESSITRDYTLGEFFRIWGKTFDGTQVLNHPATGGHEVWMLVDGVERPPSSSLVLRDGMTIEIVCDAR